MIDSNSLKGYNSNMLERDKSELFPTIYVKNTVLWQNPDISAPFDLSIGKTCNLGVFLVESQSDNIDRLKLGVDYVHHRCGLLGRIKIGDTQGNIYRDIDLKGVGYVAFARNTDKIHVFNIRKRSEEDTWGIWRNDKALRERDITEFLAKRGVRTNRMIAIIELEEIALPNGELLTIKEAKKRGALREIEKPLIGVRAFRMRDRVRHQKKQDPSVFFAAKEVVEEEKGLKLEWNEYLFWMAATLGKNLGLIHKSGYWHGMPSQHNITLAGEIVDFGFGEGSKRLEDLPFSKAQQCKQLDISQARDTVTQLMLRLASLDLASLSNATLLQTFKIFEDNYRKHL